MRKHQQRQLLELMKTIHEANNLIKKYIDNKNYGDAIKLLIDCQEAAVSIGNTIEKLEGEGTATVAHLEKFCDILYQVASSLEDNPDSLSSFKAIMSQILIIENSILNDIEADQLEVVFLPYKASMWTRWKAFGWLPKMIQNACICYTNSYYDVNQDNSLGRMNYEGNQFPTMFL